MARSEHEAEVIVVGGGLAGLATATYLGRAGARVVLFEKSATPGGRARTRVQEGFHLNQGPHALYRRGAAHRVLRELAVPFTGGMPAALPRPRRTFLLGIDRPVYVSVHSAAARLAPPGTSLVQAARYLAPDEKIEAESLRGELEGALDRLQPGWRALSITDRFVPDLTVSHALVEARRGGLRGRPEARVAGISGLYLAGDWVGPEGLLADASLASARCAAMDCLADRAALAGGSAERARISA